MAVDSFRFASIVEVPSGCIQRMPRSCLPPPHCASPSPVAFIGWPAAFGDSACTPRGDGLLCPVLVFVFGHPYQVIAGQTLSGLPGNSPFSGVAPLRLPSVAGRLFGRQYSNGNPHLLDTATVHADHDGCRVREMVPVNICWPASSPTPRLIALHAWPCDESKRRQSGLNRPQFSLCCGPCMRPVRNFSSDHTPGHVEWSAVPEKPHARSGRA